MAWKKVVGAGVAVRGRGGQGLQLVDQRRQGRGRAENPVSQVRVERRGDVRLSPEVFCGEVRDDVHGQPMLREPPSGPADRNLGSQVCDGR